MSYNRNHVIIRVNSWIARTPKIPTRLAIALINEPVKPVRCTIPVFDESMFPTLLLRSPIVIELVRDPAVIEPGTLYYIVDSNLKGGLRRVSPCRNPDYLLLTCDNADKEPWPAHYMRAAAVWAPFHVRNCTQPNTVLFPSLQFN